MKEARELARQRAAAARANMTQEQLEQARELDRQRAAAARANMTQEQLEQARELDRQRAAAARANMTQEQLEQARELDRQRATAVKRPRLAGGSPTTTTARAASRQAASSARAAATPMRPLARGRPLVRSTSGSMRRSQRSLATQPAPLTASPPSTIQPTRGAAGGAFGSSQRLQPAGISRIRRPLGLSQRNSASQAGAAAVDPVSAAATA